MTDADRRHWRLALRRLAVAWAALVLADIAGPPWSWRRLVVVVAATIFVWTERE